MSMRMTCVALAIGTITTSVSSYAQEAASIDWGKFRVTPMVESNFDFVDNVTYSSGLDETIESFRLIVTPSVSLYTESSVSKHIANYKLVNANYFSSVNDDYTDHFLDYAYSRYISDKQRIRISAEFESGHDERGRDYTIGRPFVINSPDTYNEATAQASYYLGNYKSQMQLELSLGYTKLDYDIDIQPIFDRDRSTLAAAAEYKYRLGASSNFAVSIEREDIEYGSDTRAIPLDSIKDSILVGVKWDTSAFWEGGLQLGYENKDFDSPLRKDFSGVDWLVNLEWTPVARTALIIRSEFDTRETNALGDYINEIDNRISWQHYWLEHVATLITLGYLDQEYQGPSSTEIYRKGSTNLLKANVLYEFRRWLHIDAHYSFAKRDSNLANIEYDRQVVGLSFKVTL